MLTHGTDRPRGLISELRQQFWRHRTALLSPQALLGVGSNQHFHPEPAVSSWDEPPEGGDGAGRDPERLEESAHGRQP